MSMKLVWSEATTLPVEIEDLRPDALAGRSAASVSALPARVGREAVEVGDLFRVEGDGGDGRLEIEGDVSHVRRIGAGMTSGTLTIRGDAGPHLGAGMSGGLIELIGSAGPWAGAELRGGLVHIRGSAGDGLGAAYPGSLRGMRGGMILVDGSVGLDTGLAMRRGTIAVAGRAGDGIGRAMIAGTIITFGPVGRLVGTGMKRGTIALLQPGPEFEPLPGFTATGRFRLPSMALYLRTLRHRGFPVSPGLERQNFTRSNGDRFNGGQGELLVLAEPRSERL